ncbi:protection of telomeres protein 1 [Aplochiton taeniatus]
MPVHLVKEGTDPGCQVALQLARIPIPLLSLSIDCSKQTVKGKVVHKGPLVTLDDGSFMLKTVIEEADSQPAVLSVPKSINAVLFGLIAQDFSKSVNQGAVILAAGFKLAKSPTAHKDKLHPCNLYLAAASDVYVFPSTVSAPPASVSSVRSLPPAAQVNIPAKVPKYTYVSLKDLRPGEVVNVYGVVIFFKQPFKTRGTDYCSTLKIIDQSKVKVLCTIFREKLEEHPKIFKMGDIIRLHRVKTQLFNGAISLLASFGFSAVTFDGSVGSEVEPRSTSKSLHLGPGDRQAVEELRAWATTQDLYPVGTSVPLSAAQPRMYFDLTCQLLAKATIDSNCTLLKVWDGTKCGHHLFNMFVEPSILEGNCSVSDQKHLTANVLVYDNHLELAQQLKPGDYLRIYNLHALPGTNRLPGLTADQSEQSDGLIFHLHGGSSYGRGLQILPDDSPDIQEMKRLFESFSELDANDSIVSKGLEVFSTPPESDARTCSHELEPMTLADVKRWAPPRVFHVHVQLKSYQPQKLHQALKLYCPKCTSLQDPPVERAVGELFSEALREHEPCSLNGTETQEMDLPRTSLDVPQRTVTLHLPSHLMKDRCSKWVNMLTLLRGATLEEVDTIAEEFVNVVPVQVCKGSVSLLDLTAPFLFRGKKRYYGCKQCSQAKLPEPFLAGEEALDEKSLSEVLGVQLLQYCLVVKLELQDETGTLEALLWRDAEAFFNLSAEDAAANQEAQDSIQNTMHHLCPPDSDIGKRPWLDLCVCSYTIEDQNQMCFQICNTKYTSPPSISPPP